MRGTKYGLLQSAYWIQFCIAYGFATFYLKAHGFGAGEIGMLTAGFGLLSALLQSALGHLADTSAYWDWKRLLLAVQAICLAAIVFVGLLPGKWTVGILYGTYMMCINGMLALVNSVGFYYEKHGRRVDFGKARGMGSLAYALVAFFLGKLTASLGSVPVFAAGVAASFGMLAIIWSMPVFREETMEGKVDRDKTGLEGERVHMARKYPWFMLMVAGLVLLLTFHNMICTYMLPILENVGGNSASMGTALAISAVVELPVMFAFSRIVKKYSSSFLLAFCSVSYVLRSALLWLASGIGFVLVSQLLQVFTFAIFASASVYYTEESVGKEDRMKAHAIMSNVSAIGAVVGNLAGGWLLETGGVTTMLAGAMIATAVGAALVVFVKVRQVAPGTKLC